MAIEELSSRNQRQRFMMIGGSVGAAIAFIATGMFGDVIKLIIGAALGMAIAMVIWAYVAEASRDRRAAELQQLTKADLEQQARRLNVESPTSKTKAELADAIAAKAETRDSTGDLMIETVGMVQHKMGETVDHAREKLAEHRGNDSR